MTVQNSKTAEAAVLGTLRDDAMACLTRNILPFWLENMQDRERGGWYGRMTGDGHLQKDAPRGAILYARLLWTMSAAYRVLADRACLEAATMTKRYILEHFLDREQGGTYWSLTADGQPLDTKKQFYAQGFMLYGFSEYARATGDGEALQVALQLYGLIERHAWDSRYGGYTEACTRQWQPIADMRLSAKDENYPKSQNTHLHIIEPYTNLLRCLSERGQADDAHSALQASVRRLITLHHTHPPSRDLPPGPLLRHGLDTQEHHRELWTRHRVLLAPARGGTRTGRPRRPEPGGTHCPQGGKGQRERLTARRLHGL